MPGQREKALEDLGAVQGGYGEEVEDGEDEVDGARHVGGEGQKPQGAKPQGQHQPKRDGGNAGGAQAPKRTSGGSWMSELGKRQG